jgi:hypothetical protein
MLCLEQMELSFPKVVVQEVAEVQEEKRGLIG